MEKSDLIKKGINLINESNLIAPIKKYGHPFINKISRDGNVVGTKPLLPMGEKFLINQKNTIKLLNRINESAERLEILYILEKHARKLKYEM